VKGRGQLQRAGLVAFLLSWASIAILPGVALANLWVASGGDNSGYCSQANPCATLSRAVSLAIPNATIYVAPGTITDHVTIDSSTPGLIIEGSGMRATTISGGFGQGGSVFTIESGASAEIDDLAITGGTAPNGGGVNDAGSLTMQRDLVTSNAALGPADAETGYGGGVDDSGGPLTIVDSEITFNRATNGGGGVGETFSGSTSAPLTITRDTITRNSVLGSQRPDGGVGGGVLSAGGTVAHSTIVANRVGDASGNPQGRGGGGAGASTLFTSDTIAGNVAAAGGGLYLLFVTVQGSIIAGNQGGNCGPQTFASYATDRGYNIDDNASESCGGARAGPGDIFGVDPQLGPLADNGGSLETMAIPSSSPAYDANPNCTGTDTRGVPLLQRGATRCDIGAYQVQAPSTYVANPAAGSVTAYAAGASGNAAPVLSLAGPATGLAQPTGVVADDSGRVFVSNTATSTITEYAPEVTGNVAPVATIGGTNTRLSQPAGLALDGSGNLWVAGSNGVAEYAVGASGNVAPIARIHGTLTRLTRPHALVIDQNGNVRVTNNNGTITTYAPHAQGDVAPISRVVPGRQRYLSSPQGLNIDGAGDLVVADAGASRVATYAGSADGAAKPLSFLGGGLTRPTGLDLDVSGNVFVSDNAANAIDEFAAGSSGNTGPTAQIAGPLTGLTGPAFLSELPPPPVPHVHISTRHHESCRRLLRRGIVLRVRAFGRLAFRAEPITARAVARIQHRSWASAKALPLRPGTLTLRLATAKSAAHLARRHRHTKIRVTVTIRGGFGSVRRRLTVTCSR
jgi:sugar lactone lactonase YvrE